jgi:hypothetical protein
MKKRKEMILLFTEKSLEEDPTKKVPFPSIPTLILNLGLWLGKKRIEK